jgi:hypothetical protein
VSRDYQQDQDEHHDEKSFHWSDLPGERLIAGILIPKPGTGERLEFEVTGDRQQDEDEQHDDHGSFHECVTSSNYPLYPFLALQTDRRRSISSVVSHNRLRKAASCTSGLVEAGKHSRKYSPVTPVIAGDVAQ